MRCPDGEIGRRKGLKIPRWQHRAGSTPAPGTNNPKKVQYDSTFRETDMFAADAQTGCRFG